MDRSKLRLTILSIGSGSRLLGSALQGFGQSQFEKCLSLLAAYAWEAIEELFERITGL